MKNGTGGGLAPGGTVLVCLHRPPGRHGGLRTPVSCAPCIVQGKLRRYRLEPAWNGTFSRALSGGGKVFAALFGMRIPMPYGLSVWLICEREGSHRCVLFENRRDGMCPTYADLYCGTDVPGAHFTRARLLFAVFAGYGSAAYFARLRPV